MFGKLLKAIAKGWNLFTTGLQALKNAGVDVIKEIRKPSHLSRHFKDFLNGRISRHTLQVYLRSATTSEKLKFILSHPFKYNTFRNAMLSKFKDNTKVGIIGRIEDKLGYLERVEIAKQELTSTTMTTPYEMPQEIRDLIDDVFTKREVENMTKDELHDLEKQVDNELEKRGIELDDLNKDKETGEPLDKKRDDSKSSKRLPKKRDDDVSRDAAKGAYEHYLNQWRSNFFDSDVLDYYSGELMTEQRKMEIMNEIEATLTQDQFQALDKFRKHIEKTRGEVKNKDIKFFKEKRGWRKKKI
ncbi:MAG: hypothetical protein E7Y34_02260 [Mycoplasma sp.]|nr:hypothetical protein [Mycoplasma sp.]